MEFIKATLDDLDIAFNIIEDARGRLKEAGLLQWNTGDGYPSILDIKNDILNGHLYLAKDDKILGVAALIGGLDPSYVEINGKWLTNGDNYLAIHRVAISNSAQGRNIGSFILNQSKDVAKQLGHLSIKIDTHKDNHKMLRLLDKCGFIHCGEITVESDIDSKREAFEYIIKKSLD